jgi:glutathione synthase/RimK-type ligase-like ATP-grasp enzyme
MAISILLIGNGNATSSQKLIQEAHDQGLVFDWVLPAQVAVKDNELVFVDSPDTTFGPFEYDIYLFRGMGAAAPAMHEVAKFLGSKGKRVVENCFTQRLLPEDKFVPLSKQSLYTVPEYFTITAAQWASFPDETTFPLVAKKIGYGSSKGKWVRKIYSKEDLYEFIQTAPDDVFIIQKFIEIDFDTRVLVVGEKVLGGFHRYKNEEDNFLTTAKAGRRESAQLSDAQCRAALEATALQGLEIAGVDMFVVNGTVYIIEVNCSPQFRVFDNQTGINTAKSILDYLVAS